MSQTNAKARRSTRIKTYINVARYLMKLYLHLRGSVGPSGKGYFLKAAISPEPRWVVRGERGLCYFFLMTTLNSNICSAFGDMLRAVITMVTFFVFPPLPPPRFFSARTVTG